MKNILKIIILSLFAFLCAGCASVDYTMTINKDDSAILEYLIKIDNDLINETVYTGILDTITAELESDGFVVQKNGNEFKAEKKIDNILDLDEFDSLIKLNKSPSIVTKEEGTFTTNYYFDGKIDLTGYSQTAKELKFDELIKENVDIKFNLKLPIDSESSNSGIEKSKNLTWNLNYGEENFVEVEYSLINGTSVLITMFAGIIIAIIFVVIFVIFNKRKDSKTIKF